MLLSTPAFSVVKRVFQSLQPAQYCRRVAMPGVAMAHACQTLTHNIVGRLLLC